MARSNTGTSSTRQWTLINTKKEGTKETDNVEVWKEMKDTDSRECRNCHEFESMDYTAQQRRAVNQHTKGFDEGKTCIDCHKGIAHSLPAMYEEDPSAAIGAR